MQLSMSLLDSFPGHVDLLYSVLVVLLHEVIFKRPLPVDLVGRATHVVGPWVRKQPLRGRYISD